MAIPQERSVRRQVFSIGGQKEHGEYTLAFHEHAARVECLKHDSGGSTESFALDP